MAKAKRATVRKKSPPPKPRRRRAPAEANLLVSTPASAALKVLAWLDTHATALLDAPDNGIIGAGLGRKDGGPLDDDSSPYCVTGFVEKKFSKQEMKSRSVTDFAASIRAVSASANETFFLSGAAPAGGIEIDLVETGSEFSAQPLLQIPASQRGSYGGPPPSVDLQKQFEALRIGIGVTNPEGAYPATLSVGTLGFFVRDSAGKLYLVSNNHVLANENKGSKGDAIVQPGTLDLTNTELSLLNTLPKLRRKLQIAKLSAFVPMAFHQPNGVPFNDADSAMAELVPSDKKTTEIARVGLGGVLKGVARPPAVDNTTGALIGSSRVYKAGRTTGWTEGNITAINVVSDVSYHTGTARFRNQIAITATNDNGGSFSDAGDSGSGIINDQHELVALLFAGSKTRTLANPIDVVLTQLQKALSGGDLSVVTG